MRKLLFTLAAIIGIYSSGQAQSFTTTADTVTGENNNITNTTASNITIKWHVKATNFPTDWLTPSSLGICDNSTCVSNASNALWNPGTSSGNTFTSIYNASATGIFKLAMAFTSTATTGTYYMTVNLLDNGSSYTKDVTFLITHNAPSSIPSVANAEDKTMLYPNPATNDLNVVYDANADVKNIAVYNVIGKVMNVYKVNGNSANLNIENIPSGIYFVKLYNGNGNVVVTRKFTKQ